MLTAKIMCLQKQIHDTGTIPVNKQAVDIMLQLYHQNKINKHAQRPAKQGRQTAADKKGRTHCSSERRVMLGWV